MTRGRWAVVAAVVVLLVAGGVALWRAQQEPPLCEGAREARDALLERPFAGGDARSVFVVGDSYSQGTGPDGPDGAWPARLAALARATVTVDGMSSTGYTTGGFCEGEPVTYGDRLAGDDLDGADVLVLQGSVNDGLAGDPDAVRSAAGDLLGEVDDVGRVLLVGPPDIPALEPAQLQTIDRGLADAAGEHGATYLSLLGAGIPIGDDGVHPTDAGQQRIAELVATALG
ncbi:SGNH/GDSL hydrolase family protein [Blastococcus sp. TML/M2B]|uniref:SGNH/GDSL hydrolase family protein n=1 Tax=unclassified Blastococcus TaxID=2619396 RepID=UPI001909FCDC|nr:MULTISPECIES: SGNH/GDSL hydrolase family protein [unclassified Blastococcus]MBN1093169.1 SGNH/GDSL hydrolase family protein [Blastococcus sp. TML/M2B]MBN1096717.1 SGNH/GDSL hydrolase family protein [Blastococcus sp. TML/C7B]